MDSLIKEIAEVEKQIVKSAKKKEAFVKNEGKNKIPGKSLLSDENLEEKLSQKLREKNDESKEATGDSQWLSIGLPPEKEQELVEKLSGAEWTKVKGRKKRKGRNAKKEEDQKPAVNVSQDEKLETLLYQTEYQYNSRKKKKEKRKTEWELSSILESFSITEQPPPSMQMDVSGVSESSKLIKKKKKKLKDRRKLQKEVRMEEEKPKPITKRVQAVLVDENDTIAPVSSGKETLTHKEKQRIRTQFRNKARKVKDRAERRNNRGFKEESADEEIKVKTKSPQTKGIFVGSVNKAKKGKQKKLTVEFKKNEKKLKKVMNSFNKFSVLE